jgi:hypothetical protein
VSVSKSDESSIYKDSENTQKRLSETTQTTPTTGAPDSTAPAAGAVVGDDEIQFILPEIQKLGLTPDAQTRLLALGPQTALAIAFAAQKPGVRNPGGLAVSLMAGSGPPEADLAQAKIALELRTLNREAIDGQLRRREYARLMEEINSQVAQNAGPPAGVSDETPESDAAAGGNSPAESTTAIAVRDGADPPGAQASTDPGPNATSPDISTGLDVKLNGGTLTVLDVWRAALGALKLQLNWSTYESWVEGTKALSYAGGVLTVQAKHVAARDMLTRYDWLTPTVTKYAGVPVQVRVVLAGEGVGR